MASSWSEAWSESWASAWGATMGDCAWGGAWGQSWGQSWCHEVPQEPAVIIYGGDDAPRKRRRRKEKDRNDLFRELENTVHQLLNPAPVEAPTVPAMAPLDRGAARRALDELLVLAERQHSLLQRAAALKGRLDEIEAEREWQRLMDEEDELMMWM